MSSRTLQTRDDDLKSVRPNQSMWMNRWMATSSNSPLHVQNQYTLHDGNRGKDFDLEQGDRVVQLSEPTSHKRVTVTATPSDISQHKNSRICQQGDIVVASNIPQYAKAVEVVTEAKGVEIRYETLVTDSGNLRNSRLESQTLSTINFSEKFGSILAQKRLPVSIEHESTTHKNATNVETSNSHFLFRSLRSAPTETAIQMEEWHSRPESRLQCQGQLVEPYASLDKYRLHNEEPGGRMHTFSSTRLSLGHSCTGQVSRTEELNKGCHSSSNGPQLVHHMDEWRLFSRVGSVEGVSRSPKLSHTANHLSIINVSKGHQIPKTSTISTKFKERAPKKRFTLLPGFDYQNDCSEKLLPLISSPSTTGNKDERVAFLASKNESSVKTDTMDNNVWQTWNSLPSITSSPSCKALQDPMVIKNPIVSRSTILREDLGSRKTKNELPDMNREPPSCLAAEEEIDTMDLSTSRTESLDVEHLVHVDHSGNSNSSSQPSLALSSGPSSRWVKRLKLSSSDNHAHGTKNVRIGDSSFAAKVDTSCDKVTMSRPSFSELFGEGQMELDKTSLSLGNNDTASMDLMKENCGLNLSHPWIQRWCHNQTQHSGIKSAPAVASELDISKTTLDEYQTKQLPSIAAMALMGKTMNGLQACKFQNKGSFVVWGAGGF